MLELPQSLRGTLELKQHFSQQLACREYAARGDDMLFVLVLHIGSLTHETERLVGSAFRESRPGCASFAGCCASASPDEGEGKSASKTTIVIVTVRTLGFGPSDPFESAFGVGAERQNYCCTETPRRKRGATVRNQSQAVQALGFANGTYRVGLSGAENESPE